MIKYAIALAGLALATEVSAATWHIVGANENGQKAWVETESLSRGKEYTGAWYRLQGSDGIQVIALTAVKCPSKSYMDLKMTYYDQRGESTTMDAKLSKQWDLAIPGSLMDGVLTYVCSESW